MITPTEPTVADTGMYSVTEACQALGIHRNTLRRYIVEGLIKCGFRRLNRRRFFYGREIKRCWRAQL